MLKSMFWQIWRGRNNSVGRKVRLCTVQTGCFRILMFVFQHRALACLMIWRWAWSQAYLPPVLNLRRTHLRATFGSMILLFSAIRQGRAELVSTAMANAINILL
mgnify:CR=1 FL=1